MLDDMFQWDEAKRLSNIEKHGIDFEDAIEIWSDLVLERDDPSSRSEQRIIAVGAVEGVVLVVVYTWRGDDRRIISARRAVPRERRGYYAALAGPRPETS